MYNREVVFTANQKGNGYWKIEKKIITPVLDGYKIVRTYQRIQEFPVDITSYQTVIEEKENITFRLKSKLSNLILMEILP